MRAWLDVEEAARVQKQQDELLQWDAEAHQRIIDLLDEVEKERYMALEQRAKLDTEAIARLRGE